MSASNTGALSCVALSIGYGRGHRHTRIAEDINLDLRHGEVVCLVGPNGAGKSTLLRTLTGLQPAISGHVAVDGEDLETLSGKSRARKIGVVLTEQVHVGILPVFDLVALGRHPHTDWSGRMTSDDEAIVDWALEAVGAAELRTRFANELSDGERQKVMIARALAQEPAIIVLDEPTAFLDLPRRVEIMGLLKRLARTTDRAILLSTHDLELAIQASDRLWIMESGGEVHAGAPEDLVLDGRLERAFSSEGISFDRDHGTFHLITPVRGHVGFEGKGQVATWTRRALRRSGFVTDTRDTPFCTVEVARIGEKAGWIVTSDNSRIQCTTIYELIESIESCL